MDGARAPVIDERLLAEARRMTGLQETDEIVREALTALIQREAARRLAARGGSQPDLQDIPRRRSDLPGGANKGTVISTGAASAAQWRNLVRRSQL